MTSVTFSPKNEYLENLNSPPASGGPVQQVSAQIDSANLQPAASQVQAISDMSLAGLRNCIVDRFVAQHGLEFRGDIDKLIDEEAGRLKKEGIFSTKPEAREAIFKGYCRLVDRAGRNRVRNVIIERQQIVYDVHAQVRIRDKEKEYDEVVAERAEAGKKLPAAIKAVLDLGKRLNALGIDPTQAGWKEVAQEARRKLPTHQQRIQLKKLLKDYENAEAVLDSANKNIQRLTAKLYEIRNYLGYGETDIADVEHVRQHIVFENSAFSQFLLECQDPRKFARERFIQQRIADLQDLYGGWGMVEEPTPEFSQKLCTVESILGENPLEKPDFSVVRLYALSLVDEQNYDERAKREEEELARINQRKYEIQEKLRPMVAGYDAFQQGNAALYQKICSEDVTFAHSAELLLEHEGLQYHGPCADEVVTYLKNHAQIQQILSQIGSLEDRIRALDDEIFHRLTADILAVVRPVQMSELRNIASDEYLLAARWVRSFFFMIATNPEDAEGLAEGEWDKLGDTPSNEFLSHTIIRDAVWIVRGCRTFDGTQDLTDLSHFDQAIGGLDLAAYEAVKRLSYNGLSLLQDKKSRNAMAEFVDTLERIASRSAHEGTQEVIQAAYETLKAESPDAARLLSFAIGFGMEKKPENGEAHILQNKHPSYVSLVAREIARFDMHSQEESREQSNAEPIETKSNDG